MPVYNYEVVRDNKGNGCVCGINNSLVKHQLTIAIIKLYV